MKAVNKKAAAIVLMCKGTVLLGKRIEIHNNKKVPFGGNWSLFGGALEIGESPVSAAIRELKEETNISINGKPKLIREYLTYDKFNFWAYSFELDYLPKVKLNFEHSEHGFFSPKALPEPMDHQIKKNIKIAFTDII